MKTIMMILTLVTLVNCLPSPSPAKKESSQTTESAISPSAQSLQDSMPIAKAIVAEKDLFIQTNPTMNSTTKNALNTAVIDIDKKSAAKSEEEFMASKSIIDCAITDSATNCSK